MAEDKDGQESSLILPHRAWLVTCYVKGRSSDFPLGEEVRPHLLPLLAKNDPEFVVKETYDKSFLEQNPLVRSVKELWFLTADRGVTLAGSAKGRLEEGPSGRAWLYTHRDKAIRDLGEVYEPVQLLLDLQRNGLHNCRVLAKAVLQGDGKALPVLARALSESGDNRVATLLALLPDEMRSSIEAATAATASPEAELAELQARATPCPRCGKPRRALRVRKEGPNQGRLFLACSDRECDSFEWASAAPKTAAPQRADPFAAILRTLRGHYPSCPWCEEDGVVIARATKPGRNQGRFFFKCNACEAFNWLTDEDGDFVEPDME
jgi:ssDNA-binding Zn-finger/Zn-ribbon topoisomerase 1